MQLVSRSAWGARAPTNRQPLHKNEQRGTGVHYTGSAAEAKDDHDLCAGVVRSIQRFHMDSRGWSDIAYSYLPCIHGAVFEGRGRGIRTAANGTTAGNDGYHAVCFLGGDVEGRADVTPEAKVAIREAVEWCNAWAGVSEVRPHSWFKSTECPGDELRVWIARGMPVASQPPEEDDMPTPQEIEDAMVEALKRFTAGGTIDGQTSWAKYPRVLADREADILASQKETNAKLDQLIVLLAPPPPPPIP